MSNQDIAILTTGDELLSGEISDSNTKSIAGVLAAYGYRLRCSLSVPDQEQEIVAALQYLIGHVQFVIVTGGLGSTGDDRTARAAARALGQRLVVNDEALAMVQQWFARRNRRMEPSNERQALLPQWAQPLPNSIGTAPGFRLQYQGCELFFLPGVPAEMEAMFRDAVMPLLQLQLPDANPLLQRTFKLFGVSEPKIDHLIPYPQLPDGVEVAFALDYPLVLVKLKASGIGADFFLDQAEALLLQKLGDYVLARHQETVEENVGKLLTGAGLTLSLAESCTGGLLATMLTSVPGASAFLDRAGVTYADAAKCDWLEVPKLLLEHHGAVSENCARAMASGLKHRAGTDLSLAITGIAGPDGGTTDKPVGTVFIALASESGVHVQRYTFSGDRNQVQQMSATMALAWLHRYAMQQLEI